MTIGKAVDSLGGLSGTSQSAFHLYAGHGLTRHHAGHDDFGGILTLNMVYDGSEKPPKPLPGAFMYRRESSCATEAA